MKNHRKKLTSNVSKKLFTRTAEKTNFKNLVLTPMRGGFKL